MLKQVLGQARYLSRVNGGSHLKNLVRRRFLFKAELHFEILETVLVSQVTLVLQLMWIKWGKNLTLLETQLKNYLRPFLPEPEIF